MEEFKCDFCKKTFKNKYNLKNHKVRAKSCLEIQRKNNKNVIDDLKKCTDCSGSFASNLLNRHIETCKIRRQKEINSDKETLQKLKKQLEKKDLIIFQKDLKIAKLEGELFFIKEEHKQEHECLMEIAKQPKIIQTTNNNNNNKILNMTPVDLSIEKIRDILDTKFDHNYVSTGQKGVAEFARDNLLKDNEGNLTYVCTDSDRKIFKYKDELGEVHKDTKAKKLRSKLVQAGLKEKSQEVSNKWWTDDDGDVINDRKSSLGPKKSEIDSIDRDDSIFIRELSAITTN